MQHPTKYGQLQQTTKSSSFFHPHLKVLYKWFSRGTTYYLLIFQRATGGQCSSSHAMSKRSSYSSPLQSESYKKLLLPLSQLHCCLIWLASSLIPGLFPTHEMKKKETELKYKGSCCSSWPRPFGNHLYCSCCVQCTH